MTGPCIVCGRPVEDVVHRKQGPIAAHGAHLFAEDVPAADLSCADRQLCTLQILTLVEMYPDQIFVRDTGHDGKWGSISLSNLPGPRAIAHVARWIRESRVPVRVPRPLPTVPDDE